MTTINPTTVPLVMTNAGPQATPAATLNANLIAGVAAEVPNYTANLPGLLIEDVSSTATGALVTIDQARVDAVASITPYGANAYILSQQGVMLGIPQGVPSNGSVFVVFAGPAGYVIVPGFVVSDGTNQYVIQDGGIVGASGFTSPLFAVATQSGSFAIPLNTVNQIVTSLPSPYNTQVTVNNPTAGTPGNPSAESVQSYRSRVMLANQVAGQGTPAYIKTLLNAIPGVTPRLIAVPQTTLGWEVICGGGDPYAVAFAIYKGVLDLSTIVGSITSARNIAVTIIDSPDQYTITYVNPPQQTVAVTATWNTNLPNFTSGAQVDQLGSTAIQNYINSIIVGQPINVFAMEDAFQQAVSSVLPIANLTRLVFSVTVNGNPVTPATGTGIIASDSESFFFVSASGVSVVQG